MVKYSWWFVRMNLMYCLNHHYAVPSTCLNNIMYWSHSRDGESFHSPHQIPLQPHQARLQAWDRMGDKMFQGTRGSIGSIDLSNRTSMNQVFFINQSGTHPFQSICFHVFKMFSSWIQLRISAESRPSSRRLRERSGLHGCASSLLALRLQAKAANDLMLRLQKGQWIHGTWWLVDGYMARFIYGSFMVHEGEWQMLATLKWDFGQSMNSGYPCCTTKSA